MMQIYSDMPVPPGASAPGHRVQVAIHASIGRVAGSFGERQRAMSKRNSDWYIPPEALGLLGTLLFVPSIGEPAVV